MKLKLIVPLCSSHAEEVGGIFDYDGSRLLVCSEKYCSLTATRLVQVEVDTSGSDLVQAELYKDAPKLKEEERKKLESDFRRKNR
jgi:hypothetical protein